MAGLMDFLGGGMFGGTDAYGSLLSDEMKKKMQQQAMMTMAAKLMQAGGPSRTPTNLGQALGGAFMAGQQAYGQAGQNALTQMLTKQKIEEYQRGLKQNEAFSKALQAAIGGGGAAPGAQQPMPQSGFAPGVSGGTFAGEGDVGQVAAPMQAMQAQAQPGGMSGVFANMNPQQLKLLAAMPAADARKLVMEKAFQDDPEIIRTMRSLGMPITPENYMKLKKASATNVTQTMTQGTDKAIASSVGGAIGNMLSDQTAAARTAVATLGNLDNIQSALGKAITGPGADIQTTMLRIGDALGVAGADAQEKLANTRVLVQGMARQELNDAQMMKGQGQITEAERAILRRASLGDQTMTAAEIGTAVQVMRKIAQAKIDQQAATLQQYQKLPGADMYAPFFQVQPYTAPVQGGGGNNGLQFMIQQELQRRGAK